MKQGHLDQALQMLNSLNDGGHEPKGTEYLRGLVLYEKGKMIEAAAAFSNAIGQDPSDQEAMKMEGASLFRSGKAAEAIPFLEKAQGSTPENNVDPQYVLGLCYVDVGRYDDARRAFAKQYEFAPDSAPAYLLEARMLLRRNSLIVAEKDARKALELKPTLPQAHLLLGQIALAQGNVSEAVAQLALEVELNPLDGTAYDRLGDAYIRGGDYASAQKFLDRAVLLEPTLNIPYILLGEAMLRQHDPLRASMYLEHALQIDDKNAMAHALLGQAYRSMGRKDDAVIEFKAAVKLQQADSPAPEAQK